MKAKKRLDVLMVEKNLAQSRNIAKALIMSGNVLVNGVRAVKSGEMLSEDDVITIIEKPQFVSRGGLKLALTIKQMMPIEIEGRICIDIGASTGGFTDFLLQNSAQMVYAVDVGRGLLAERLKKDPRVKVLDKTNARYINTINFSPSPTLATIDVSFISLKLIIPPLLEIMSTPREVVALLKPQFEAERKFIRKGGVVRNGEVINRIIENMTSFIVNLNCKLLQIVPSTIKGPKGNQEYFIHFNKIEK
ncbi:MAG: TlyA family RNA methyltransferase [bacterium]